MPVQRILVLDDCSNRHLLFRIHLEGGGATVQAAHTAVECIGLLRDQPWDVVFLDHDLVMSPEPCGDGMVVVHWLLGLAYGEPDHPALKSRYCIHSMNEIHGPEMYELLVRSGFRTHRCLEAWTKGAELRELARTGRWMLPHCEFRTLDWGDHG